MASMSFILKLVPWPLVKQARQVDRTTIPSRFSPFGSQVVDKMGIGRWKRASNLLSRGPQHEIPKLTQIPCLNQI